MNIFTATALRAGTSIQRRNRRRGVWARATQLAVVAFLLTPMLAMAQSATSTTVFPTLRGLTPDSALANSDVTATATGGYLVRPDGSVDRSERRFALFFDRVEVGALTCENDSCNAEFLVPAGAAPGEHQVSTEGGSSLALTVVEQEPPLRMSQPPAVSSEAFSALAPKEPRNTPAGPGDITSKAGTIVETDVVTLAGTADSPPYVFVTAAGSGKQHKLTRWSVGNDGLQAQADSAAVDGSDVKLHNPGLGGILVSTALDAQGNLWLSSWRTQNSELVRVQTRGYGANAKVNVSRYDVTGRSLSPDLAEIVTLIVDQDDALRMVTWHVDSNGGLFAKKATTSVSEGLKIFEGGAPVISHQRDNQYVANFGEAVTNNLAWQYYSVAADGNVALNGETNQRANIRGTSTSTDSASFGVDSLPLTGDGQTVVTVNGAADAATPVRLTTYEHFQVDAVYGPPYQIAASTADLNPNAPGVLVSPPVLSANLNYMLTDGLYEAALGTGQGNLLSNQMFSPPTPATGMASVTKAMTLDRVLAAVAEGKVALSDKVTLTDEMIGGDGLSYWEELARMTKMVDGAPQRVGVGDQVTLGTLLQASIMLSDRVATLAAAFHAADALYNDDDSLSFGELVGTTGSQGLFVDDMNARAAQLGMSNTLYCGTYGEANSVPQDQITLWSAAGSNDNFRDVVSKMAFTAEDSAAESAVTGISIVPFAKITDSAEVYPGLRGAKGGSAGSLYGVGYVGNELQCNLPSPGPRPCIRCLATHHERLGRPMFTAQTQAAGTNVRGNNAMALLDFGYQRTFTPDHLAGSGEQGGEVGDFGLASLDPVLNVTTAIIDGTSLETCLWNVSETAIAKSECQQRIYQGLQAGGSPNPVSHFAAGGVRPNAPEPAVVDMEDVTSVGADADYLVAVRRLGKLSLDLWRVGPRPVGIVPQ